MHYSWSVVDKTENWLEALESRDLVLARPPRPRLEKAFLPLESSNVF